MRRSSLLLGTTACFMALFWVFGGAHMLAFMLVWKAVRRSSTMTILG